MMRGEKNCTGEEKSALFWREMKYLFRGEKPEEKRKKSHFQILVDFSCRIGVISKKIKNYDYFLKFFSPILMFHKSSLCHVRSHTNFGPDRLSRFDVYQLQTNKQTDRQAKYIYRCMWEKKIWRVGGGEWISSHWNVYKKGILSSRKYHIVNL